MKKLLLIGIFILLGFSQAYANITKTLTHNLTISNVPINGTTVGANSTITSDSIYQAGASSQGYSALATTIAGSSPNMKITYQVSYDNVNWFNQNTTAQGTLTAQNVLATSITSSTWISYTYITYPYIRFNFQNTTATADTITADTMWQDWT